MLSKLSLLIRRRGTGGGIHTKHQDALYVPTSPMMTHLPRLTERPFGYRDLITTLGADLIVHRPNPSFFNFYSTYVCLLHVVKHMREIITD